MAFSTSNTTYHPITGFFRDMQESVLPKDMKDNIASRWIEVISDATEHKGDGVDDWLIREIGSRLAAAAMPVFVALATVQLAGVLVCQVTLMALGQDHGDIDKCATDLLRMVFALFTSVIAWPFSLIDPKVYQREKTSTSPDPDLKAENQSLKKHVKDLERQLAHLPTAEHTLVKASSWDQLCFKSGRTSGAATHKYDYSIGDLLDPISTWQANGGGIDGTPTDFTLSESQKEQFLCPEDTLELTCDFTDSAHYAGLKALLSRSYELDRLVIQGAYNEDGVSDKESPILADLLALDPKSMIGQVHTLVLREMDVTVQTLQKIAARFTNIACFDIKTCKIQGDIELLEKDHIVLYQEPSRSVGHNNIQEQYNHLNAHLKAFVQDYSPYGFVRHVKNGWKLRTGETVDDKGIIRGSDKRPIPVKLYTGDASKICRHPAAPFIRTVGFLKKTEIRDNHFRDLRQSLKHFFPNMILLDLSYCKNLCVDTLEYITYLGVQEVYLGECHHIMYKRLPSRIPGTSDAHPETRAVLNTPEAIQIYNANKGKEPPTETVIQLAVEIPGETGEAGTSTVRREEKHYKTDGSRVYEFVPQAFTRGIIDLYLGEVENIRLDGVQRVKDCIHLGISNVMSRMERHLKSNVRLTFYNPDKEGSGDTTSTFQFEHVPSHRDASPQRGRIAKRNRNKSPAGGRE